MSKIEQVNKEKLKELKEKLKESAHKLTFHKNLSSFDLLKQAKFDRVGYDPENPVEDIKKRFNFIEQVNQTFTLMVTYRAVEWLWANGYKSQKFTLNLGTRDGTDISNDGVAAEAFAAVKTSNNSKLNRDITKVCKESTKKQEKFVFYTSTEIPPKRRKKYNKQEDGTKVFDNEDVKEVYFPLDDLVKFYKK